MSHISKVVDAWRAGGFYDRVMDSGPELERLKAFVQICAGERPNAAASAQQQPHYPCFPGLNHSAWWDPEQFEAARILEANFETILAESRGLPTDAPVDYSMATAPPPSLKRPWTLFRRPQPRTWTLYLLYHLGVAVEPVTGAAPRTLALLQTLPGACRDYSWGDFVFSAFRPGAHLPAHWSMDNLRVRLHLGLEAPQNCGLRVGDETRSWTAGRCLAFEDCFEHEAWNRSAERRVVLIVDLWHPDLTEVEVQGLTAAFRKSEVRRIFMHERIGISDSSARFLPFIEARLAEQDEDPVVRAYWPGSA